jgi:hypothetical protein
MTSLPAEKSFSPALPTILLLALLTCLMTVLLTILLTGHTH